MKCMIDTEKFLDKLLYMGYMDEEKSKVEEVANNMIEDAYTKDEVITMLEEIKDEANNICPTILNCASFTEGIRSYNNIIQQKINKLKENINE